MIKRYSKMILGVFCVCLMGVLVVLSGCQSHQEKQAAERREDVQKAQVKIQNPPLVALHGTPGDEHAWDTMLERLEQTHDVVEEPLIRVSKDGRVSMDGSWKNAKNPVILIHFDNNNAPDRDQAEWLEHVFQFLHDMGIKKNNYIAHSQGGVALAYYLAFEQKQHLKDNVALNKVMTLGSPYNELDAHKNKAPISETKTLKEIKHGFKTSPVKVNAWFDVYGNMNGQDDQIVPIESARSIIPLLKEKGVRVKEDELKNHNHSLIHETDEALTLIETYFYSNHK